MPYYTICYTYIGYHGMSMDYRKGFCVPTVHPTPPTSPTIGVVKRASRNCKKLGLFLFPASKDVYYLIQGVFFDWSPLKSLSIEILYENT